MKTALFVFVSFALLAGLSADILSFPFGTPPLESDVMTAEIEIPFDYKGVVTVTPNTEQTENDLFLCVNWLVPIEAPAGEPLDEVWSMTCQNYTELISNDGNDTPFSLYLRAGTNYFSLAILGDVESTGTTNDDSFDVTLDVTYETCPDLSFGEDCQPYTSLAYDTEATVTIGGPGETTAYVIPTMNPETTKFVKNLEIKFEFADEGPDNGLNLLVRYNGPPSGEIKYDFVCSGFDEKCQIPTPWLTNTQEKFITLVAFSTEELSATVTAHQNTCGNKLVPKENGKDCQNYEELDSKAGKVSKYKGKEYFVFLEPTARIAIGGLDSYDQTDIAPPVYAQFDNIPNLKDEDQPNYVLLSNGSKTNVLEIDLSDAVGAGFADSKIVLFVDTKKSYGIWNIAPEDNVTCAAGCKHGVCDEDTFVCTCDKNYEDLGCDHKKSDFTIEYIILIAVGGLLVIAMVIGVPMYCFLNKSDNSYETVS